MSLLYAVCDYYTRYINPPKENGPSEVLKQDNPDRELSINELNPLNAQYNQLDKKHKILPEVKLSDYENLEQKEHIEKLSQKVREWHEENSEKNLWVLFDPKRKFGPNASCRPEGDIIFYTDNLTTDALKFNLEHEMGHVHHKHYEIPIRTFKTQLMWTASLANICYTIYRIYTAHKKTTPLVGRELLTTVIANYLFALGINTLAETNIYFRNTLIKERELEADSYASQNCSTSDIAAALEHFYQCAYTDGINNQASFPCRFDPYTQEDSRLKQLALFFLNSQDFVTSVTDSYFRAYHDLKKMLYPIQRIYNTDYMQQTENQKKRERKEIDYWQEMNSLSSTHPPLSIRKAYLDAQISDEQVQAISNYSKMEQEIKIVSKGVQYATTAAWIGLGLLVKRVL